MPLQEVVNELTDVMDGRLYLACDILIDMFIVEVFVDDLFDVSIAMPYCYAHIFVCLNDDEFVIVLQGF